MAPGRNSYGISSTLIDPSQRRLSTRRKSPSGLAILAGMTVMACIGCLLAMVLLPLFGG